jgi:hypothetical protein
VVPAVVVVIAVAVAIGAASTDGRGALFGYDAAVVTLAVIGAIAAAMLAVGSIRLRWATVVPSRWARHAVGVAALAFVAVLATTIASARPPEDPTVRVVPRSDAPGTPRRDPVGAPGRRLPDGSTTSRRGSFPRAASDGPSTTSCSRAPSSAGRD